MGGARVGKGRKGVGVEEVIGDGRLEFGVRRSELGDGLIGLEEFCATVDS